jgi:hypothetical protein
MIPEFRFRAKAYKVRQGVDGPVRERVDIPTPTRSHTTATANAFRNGSHEREWYYNSALFPAILRHAVDVRIPTGYIYLDDLPAGVVVAPGFLVSVSIQFPNGPKGGVQ